MNCFLLHIETATRVCSVALSNNGQLIASKETDDSEYVHGEVLTLFIEEVLQQANLTVNQLSAVSVTSGPGSYTGLRIGLSTAKGLCYALNIPLIAIDALFNLATLAKKQHPNTTICSMIDARRMEVFAAVYAVDGTPLKPISADILDEQSYVEYEPFLAVGDGAEKMKEVWQHRPIDFDNNIQSSATGHVTVAFEKFQTQQFEDVAYFEPFYLKDFVGAKKN